MANQQFVREIMLPVPRETAFEWHERAGAFERLTPPWEPVELIARRGTIRNGDQATIQMRIGPLVRHWKAEHRNFRRGHAFEDIQLSGPFAYWYHRHEFEEVTDHRSRMRDRIEYRLPLAPMSQWLGGWIARRKLETMFRYRQETLADDLQRHGVVPDPRPRRVAITGASGLVGVPLAAILNTGGHEVLRLVRREPQAPDEVRWDPQQGVPDPAKLEGLDAVIHLAGAGIADKRWSKQRMAVIESSRVEGTRSLVQALGRLERPPATFLAASAVGIYGDTGDEVHTEEFPAGDDFLATIGRRWEEEADGASQFGCRVVKLRLGPILTPAGGMLAKLLPVFKAGLGGPAGDGRQYVSWVSIDDAVWAFHHALVRDDVAGSVNVTAPQPVTNAEFGKALGRVLGRPAVFPTPAFAIRAAFGKMADATVLISQRAEPRRLLEQGYVFRDPEIEGALRRLLGRP